uniref:Uncharacterized protein n=1 Tax=Rangifer tarandus platyrhynchus TaxID=3082113 RepID=A0ACB0FN21_RANTA|nr:unnamed protein product [Rangifer tarandus platyrhynchus]
MPKRLPFLCALGAYKLLRRAFVSLLFSWQVVPRQNSAFSLSLAPLPAVRRSPLLASSSDPARSLSEPLPVPSAAAPLTRRAPGPRSCGRCVGFWGCASIRVLVVAEEGNKKKREKRQEKGDPSERKKRRRQKKATSDGKLVRTGAVGKNGKVDRRRRHKSVSGPGERGRRRLLCAQGGRAGAQAATARDFSSSHLASELPPQPQPQLGGEQEPARSGRRAPAQGTWGSQGVVFGSEEVPAQPSKFCPKADKRIAPR